MRNIGFQYLNQPTIQRNKLQQHFVLNGLISNKVCVYVVIFILFCYTYILNIANKYYK